AGGPETRESPAPSPTCGTSRARSTRAPARVLARAARGTSLRSAPWCWRDWDSSSDRGRACCALYDMKISLYTAMRNCIENDYPFVEMLKHHLPLADEIVINEGYSTDGTYEAIRDLDPKIKIFRTKWDRPKGESWWIHFKDAARRQCTGDWCLHLDSDEFLP